VNALVIFLKYPEPGKVKTRLGAVIGYDIAAELYRIFIQKTVTMAGSSRAEKKYIAYTPVQRRLDIAREIPSRDFDYIAQHGEDLGEKMVNAFKTVFAEGHGPVVIIGSDSPTLPVEIIDEAFLQLRTADLVLSPAADGGYTLIGMNVLYAELFRGIEWSSQTVLWSTVQKAEDLGLHCILLPEWYDVDDLDTLRRAIKDDHTGQLHSFWQKHATELSKI
jgi:rSAM/selenodomain-associated transferase 1